MISRAGVVALGLALLAAPLGAQEDLGTRLAGRVPPGIAALVQELAAVAAARGLPIDPVVQKAIEGSAKGVPADRVAAAIRRVAAQIDAAAAALRGDGLSPVDTAVIAAGAFALNAGLGDRNVAELARASHPPTAAAVTLRVAGTLAALGVPAAETVALVSTALAAGRSPAELLALPGRLQAEMARGVPPAQAAAGLARAAAAAGHRGPPPHPGPPPARPRP